MSNKYHTRKGYEQLLFNILKQKGSDYTPNISKISDYQLLTCINSELRSASCIEFFDAELLMDLQNN